MMYSIPLYFINVGLLNKVDNLLLLLCLLESFCNNTSSSIPVQITQLKTHWKTQGNKRVIARHTVVFWILLISKSFGSSFLFTAAMCFRTFSDFSYLPFIKYHLGDSGKTLEHKQLKQYYHTVCVGTCSIKYIGRSNLSTGIIIW